MNRALIPTLGACFSLSVIAYGQTYPGGFNGTTLATGLSFPTAFCIAPDETIYICLKSGSMRVWKDGIGLLPEQLFANNPLNVVSFGERGLLGVAVDPNFLSNRYIYVFYSARLPAIHNRISRFSLDSNGDLALPGSEVILLELDDFYAAYNHNGGALHFGPDGMLYAGVGDNTYGMNSQSIDTLCGKILRISPTPGSVIPDDNPAVFPGITGSPKGNNRAIWAVGLRNPYTFAFHPISGRMFINDVGRIDWEEINEGLTKKTRGLNHGQTSGQNYGWPETEGPFNKNSFPDFSNPFFSYSHTEVGGGSAITGGTFYAPKIGSYPSEYYGSYFYSDYVTQLIRRLNINTAEVNEFAESTGRAVDLRIDSKGRLIFASINQSSLVRVDYTTPFAPVITEKAANQIAIEGDDIKLTVSVAANPMPRFSWLHNGIELKDGNNISGSTTSTLGVSGMTRENSGQYRCIVENSVGAVISDAASVTMKMPRESRDND